MAHPFICPNCNQRAGMVDLQTGISECAVCGTKWQRPRVVLGPPKDDESLDEWAESFVMALTDDEQEEKGEQPNR